MRVMDCKVDGRKDFVLAAPIVSDHLCEPCAAHFAGVREGLEEAGIAYEIDPRLVRGLDYYTRTAFEFVAGALSAGQATVCGGGRYDGLAEVLGGPATPGIGFGLGLDRVLLALEGEGVPPPPARGPRCFIVTVGEGSRAAGGALLARLRSAGIPSARAFEERPMKAQFKMADRAEADFVAILGAEELAGGTVTLRRLVDGVQKSVPDSRRRTLADPTRRLDRLDDRHAHHHAHPCGRRAPSRRTKRPRSRSADGSRTAATTAGVTFIDLRDREGVRAAGLPSAGGAGDARRRPVPRRRGRDPRDRRRARAARRGCGTRTSAPATSRWR